MSSGGLSVETLLYERRRQRLAAGALALTRLEEVIRLVVGAYGVRVAWMPERLPETREAQDDNPDNHAGNARNAVSSEDASAELRIIAARLATMGQHPLLIGDPVRRVIWLSRRPFTMTMQRVTGMIPSPLERVGQGCQLRQTPPAATPAVSPAMLLWEASGPAARVLLAQSDALLSVAPRLVEDCGASLLRGQRYVLVAPRGIYVTHGDALTSWSERLLCLPICVERPASPLSAMVRSAADVGVVRVANVRR